MAGTESEDNPLPVNVVPMVDVIFCLCVFFLASFHVRAQESHFDNWLPKDRGEGPMAAGAPLTELRVILGWRPETQELTRRFGKRDLHDAAEMAAVVREAHEALLEQHATETPLILDAESGVPWAAAIEVVNLSRELGIEHLEFAQGPR
jgi:biopolymer transport protein ExbD